MKCMATNATIKSHSVFPRDQNSELSKQCTLVEQQWLPSQKAEGIMPVDPTLQCILRPGHNQLSSAQNWP